jgi:hypothetical protein
MDATKRLKIACKRRVLSVELDIALFRHLTTEELIPTRNLHSLIFGDLGQQRMIYKLSL